MPDNDEPQPAVNQQAVAPQGVSDAYVTQPTTFFDLQAAQAREEKTAEDKQKEREEAFKANLASPFAGGENTDAIENFVGTDTEYQNYGDVSHAPLVADEETPERKAEERILAAMDDRNSNSAAATGGHTTYGESVEVDPVGRSGAIVRGGTGDSNTAAGQTDSPASPDPESQPAEDAAPAEPAKAAAAAKKAAPKPASD